MTLLRYRGYISPPTCTRSLLDSLKVLEVFFILNLPRLFELVKLQLVIITVLLKLALVDSAVGGERKRVNVPKSDATASGLMKC